MKKVLLLLAGAAVAASALADNNPAIYDNLMLQKMSSDANWLVSDDGTGSMIIIDRVNNKQYEYQTTEDTFYAVGIGNCVSNNGIVLASITNGMMDASYWQNGEWIALPVGEADNGMCGAQGITPDGKRICGYVGQSAMSVDASSIMVLPAVWTMGEDGKYGMYTALPHPELDFSGRLPQYITAVAISDDGKTVCGQVGDYTGSCMQPIIYNQAEDGTWSYTLLMEDKFKPAGEAWPVWPGDDAPVIQDYMTEAQKEAYDAAVDAYTEAYAEYQANKPMPEDYLSPEEREAWQEAVDNWNPEESYFPPSATEFLSEEEYAKYQEDLDKWFAEGQAPNIMDYMTEEEIAAYNQACEDYTGGEFPQAEDYISAAGLAKYNAALAEWKKNPLCYPDIDDFVSPDKLAQYKADYQKWDEEFNAFMDKYYEVTAELPAFVFNNTMLSPNGKYFASTSLVSDFWSPTETSSTYIFDLESGNYIEKDAEGIVTWVGNEGQIATASPSRAVDRSSFISTSLEGEMMTFQDFVKEKNQDLYKWMEDNMRHDYYYYEYDYENDTEELVCEENKWFTGTVTPSADMKTFVSWIGNTWSEDPDAPYYYSYWLSLDYVAGQTSAIAESDIEISADANGNVSVKGNPANITVFDMSGREVFRSQGAANSFSTGLNSGMYIIKATDAKGASKILKSAF